MSKTTYTLTRQTRTAFTNGIPTKVSYFKVDVYVDGKRINFGFVNDENDQVGIDRVIQDVLEWANTPSDVLESMHSARD